MSQFHKYLGVVLFLPFIGWVITGIFFFVKPGYQDAYNRLIVTTYPLKSQYQIISQPDWQEVRLLKTILGEHLLARSGDVWRHYNPRTLEEVNIPEERQVRLIVEDAIKNNLKRYGKIISVERLKVVTENQVKITLDWSQLKLHQTGKDTEFINQMYKIHYLQWSGIEGVDRIMGVIGLMAVLLLTLLGLRMSISRRKTNNRKK